MLLLQSDGQVCLPHAGRNVGWMQRLSSGVSRSCNSQHGLYHCLNKLAFFSQQERARVLQKILGLPLGHVLTQLVCTATFLSRICKTTKQPSFQ